eukprot:m.107361 g.107361  ORF g.107361 m.107361 type:complete len:92 (+) comp37291_c0_seq28:352-627(+)
MAEMQKNEKKKEEKKMLKKHQEQKVRRDDIEDEDDQESYFKYMETVMVPYDEEDEHEDTVEYDMDGNPIYKKPKVTNPAFIFDFYQQKVFR